MASKSDSKTAPSFEDNLKELEDILAELESSRVPLADLVEKYSRAKRCLEACKAQLDEAKMRVGELTDAGVEEFLP